MVWKPFGSAGRIPDEEAEHRTEIACALMMGARFELDQNYWYCYDDTEESSKRQCGNWNFKVNAARAYLSTKGVFFDKQGNPVAHSIMRSPVAGRKEDQHGRG